MRGVYLRATYRIVRAPFNAHREHDRMQYAGRGDNLI
jgi:hypothetical protein